MSLGWGGWLGTPARRSASALCICQGVRTVIRLGRNKQAAAPWPTAPHWDRLILSHVSACPSVPSCLAFCLVVSQPVVASPIVYRSLLPSHADNNVPPLLPYPTDLSLQCRILTAQRRGRPVPMSTTTFTLPTQPPVHHPTARHTATHLHTTHTFSTNRLSNGLVRLLQRPRLSRISLSFERPMSPPMAPQSTRPPVASANVCKRHV